MTIDKCNHRINSKASSISLLSNFKTFVFPKKVYGICKICGKNFEYISDEKGDLKLYNKNKEGENDVNV